MPRAAAGGLAFYFGIVPPLGERITYTYRGSVQNVASGMIARIYNHSHAISAELEIPSAGAEGVILAEADHLGGLSLFVEDGTLRHTYSLTGVRASPAWTSDATTAHLSTATTDPHSHSGTIRKVVFDVDPILTEEGRAAIHSARSTPPWRRDRRLSDHCALWFASTRGALASAWKRARRSAALHRSLCLEAAARATPCRANLPAARLSFG
jgi:hypothetical protein